MTAEEKRELYRWGLSGAVVLAAHFTAVAYVLNYRDAISPAEAPAAVVIDLSPVAAAPSIQEIELPPLPEQPQTEDIPEKPIEEIVEKEVPPQEQPTPPEPVMEPLPPETPPVPEPEVPLPPPPPPPPEKKPETVVEPEPVKPEPPKQKPPSKPSIASSPRPMPKQAPKMTAPVSSASESNSNAIPNWRSLLAAILERNKRYPSEARNRGERGVASVSFTISRSGALIGARLVRSSGSDALDQEAVALVQRSHPFPPPPPELRGNTITIVVPVRFNIR